MYKCLDCGLIFEKPKIYCEDFSPSCSFEGGKFIAEYSGCPRCEGAFKEADCCSNCGNIDILKKYKNEGFWCENCIEEKEKENEKRSTINLF